MPRMLQAQGRTVPPFVPQVTSILVVKLVLVLGYRVYCGAETGFVKCRTDVNVLHDRLRGPFLTFPNAIRGLRKCKKAL